jgi:hypothetical protein
MIDAGDLKWLAMSLSDQIINEFGKWPDAANEYMSKVIVTK